MSASCPEPMKFENMRAVAAQYSFPFPYLHDDTQRVARADPIRTSPPVCGERLNLVP